MGPIDQGRVTPDFLVEKITEWHAQHGGGRVWIEEVCMPYLVLFYIANMLLASYVPLSVENELHWADGSRQSEH